MAQINLDTLPRTRKEAQALGSKHYFTGKPCIKGHTRARITSNGRCLECKRLASARDGATRRVSRKESVLSMRIPCDQCGVAFTPPWGKGIKLTKYCGTDCRSEAKKVHRREWLQANRELMRKANCKYRKRVQEEKGEQWAKERKRNYAYRAQRLQTDLSFRFVQKLRNRYNQALKRLQTQKTTSVTKLAGCSISDLRAHIETQFQPGMTWDNWARDGWHLDHIKPIASFDRPDHPDCWHYSNLQPLWAEDNLKKGARLAACPQHSKASLAQAVTIAQAASGRSTPIPRACLAKSKVD